MPKSSSYRRRTFKSRSAAAKKGWRSRRSRSSINRQQPKRYRENSRERSGTYRYYSGAQVGITDVQNAERRRVSRSAPKGRYASPEARARLEELYPEVRRRYAMEQAQYFDIEGTREEIIDLALYYYRPGQYADALREAMYRMRVEH